MKKTSLLKIAALLCSVILIILSFASCAKKDNTPKVYVTLSDSTGKAVLAHAAVKLTDADGDGKLTFNDAMINAHDAYYEGGAEKGYATAEGSYGLYVAKLLGGGDGVSYGYYINNVSAMSPLDEIKENDEINAFTYRDTQYYSDTYCFFDKSTASLAKGEKLTLTLTAAGWDESYNPVTKPFAGAVITIDGEKTEFVTDAEGKVEITLTKGTHVVSAVSDTVILVPTICIVTAK